MINICLRQPSAKARIIRHIKSTEFVTRLEQTSDELISFKYYILLEDDPAKKDILYFLEISLKSIIKGINSMTTDSLENSLEILEDMKRSRYYENVCSLDDSAIGSSMFDSFVTTLSEKFEEINPTNIQYFNRSFQFLIHVLNIDESVSKKLEVFVNDVCNSKLPLSSDVLEFLSKFTSTRSSTKRDSQVKQIIEKSFQSFDTKVDNFRQRFAFMKLVRNYKLGDFKYQLDMEVAYKYFKNTLEFFQNSNIQKMSDEDFHYFIHVVYSLHAFESDLRMKSLLNEFVNWKMCKVIAARCFLSSNPEVVKICVQLSNIEEFPSDLTAELLTRSTTRKNFHFNVVTEKNSPDTLYSKAIKDKISNQLEDTIDLINKTLQNNDVSKLRISDVIEIYSRKIDIVQGVNDSLQRKIDESSAMNCELNKIIQSYASISQQQDTYNWSLETEKEILENSKKEKMLRILELENENYQLKDSVKTFSARLLEQNDIHMESENRLKQEIDGKFLSTKSHKCLLTFFSIRFEKCKKRSRETNARNEQES